MIRCWDKDGQEVNVTKFTQPEDSDLSDVTTQLIPLLSFMSQKAKVIITKVLIEDNDMKMVIEQK